MFRREETIRLRDTDATGVIYFTEQLRLASETFESFYPLKELFEGGDFLIPIVDASCTYSAPLRFGDKIQIEMSLLSVGNSSFSLGFKFTKSGSLEEVGVAKITHVAVCKNTGKALPLPVDFISILHKIMDG